MIHSHTADTHANPTHTEWPSAIASLLVGSGFFALWFWLLPRWLGFEPQPASGQWISIAPSILGFAVALRCVWDFGATGRGTPMPAVPPQKLVVVGFYRYVRNPMYLGFFTGWISLGIVFGQANWAVITGAAAAIIGVALFVRLYEEPTLRRMFGADYEKYCQNVPRWLPRVRPWQPPTSRGLE